MELAIGLFAVALVTTVLAAFVLYIVRSLKMQNSVRVGASAQSATVEVPTFAADYAIGSTQLRIRESATLPPTVITTPAAP